MTNTQQLKELREEVDTLKGIIVFLTQYVFPHDEKTLDEIKRRLGIEE